MEKIWLDTDIGSDIDDAVCLAYLLRQPQCDLLGISTVSGAPAERAKLASALCAAAGRRVPIFPGAEAPLLGPQRQPEVPQAARLAGWAHDEDFPAGQAVAAMRTAVRESPGQVTLLAVGPMTNVALLFALDPEVSKLLKRLVLMCGVFGQCPPGWDTEDEWNALCDPVAAAMVYAAPVAEHVSIGLDVTGRVAMGRAEVEKRFTGPVLTAVRDFAGVWFDGERQMFFHDPLAGAFVFQPELLRLERGVVEPEVCGQRPGRTRWTPDAAGPHQVALGVDVAGFFGHYFAVAAG